MVYHEAGSDAFNLASVAFGIAEIKAAKDVEGGLEKEVVKTEEKVEENAAKDAEETLEETWQLSKQNLGKPASSKVLGENLEAVGKIRPENSAAHHIVPGGETYINAKEARGLIEEAEIDINEATNGVFLPKGSKYVIDDAIAHSKVHTNKYYDNLYDRLKSVSKEDRRMELQKISEELLNGTFPY